ncbi:hypothetical protein C8Q73DRAFT_296912 [Cubamyces lactineus]|nr:hypothetical protein C8Q73DRAFT_296912 [Cubamyces lactineus]
MPSLRIVRKGQSGDALAVIVSALEVVQEASSAVAAVPFLGSIIGAALGIARTVEKIRSDRERYVRLARRVSEFSRHIEESLASDPQAVDDNLKVNLIEIQVLLTRIRNDVEAELKRKPLSRFLLQSSIADMLDDRMDELDSAWRAFDTACLIALRMKLERQAMYDDHSQLRLFRWSDLRCLKVRGSYSVRGQAIGEEWEGRWGGRAVVIRTVKGRASSGAEICPEAMVTYYPKMYFDLSRYARGTLTVLPIRHHPYLAQVVGYSHPALEDRFYVMDTGVIPLIHQFRGKDILPRLLQWLQHIIDYQSAFNYLYEAGIAFNECHSHNRCLPSAMLNEEGRLIVDTADLEDASPGCFQSRLRTLYDE